MPDDYRIFGVELSPYSVKVRSYFRYKAIPHRWIIRNADSQAEYQKYAKLPLVPLVVTPNGEGIQDSTPLIERIESVHPQPTIYPADPIAGFISALLEEFGDEWGNKWMFHYRWARDVDQISSAGRLAQTMMPTADEKTLAFATAQVRERMVGRVWFVGSSPQTAPQIERSFADTLAILEAHLSKRPYLFGARPAFGDFGMWGQLYEAWSDPTPGAMIGGCYPNVLAWIQRMFFPHAEGEFEPWPSLEPTLMPLLERQVGRSSCRGRLPTPPRLPQGPRSSASNYRAERGSRSRRSITSNHSRRCERSTPRFLISAAVDAVLERAGCLKGMRG